MMKSTVRDVMTTDVVAVPESADYKQIITVLRQRRVSAVPVVDTASRVVGVVSEADLLYKEAAHALPKGTVRLAWLLKEPSKAAATTAAGLMTKPAVTIAAGATVADAARLMQASHVKRLPVVDDDGRLAGIVSRADVLSVFERPDAEVRDDVVKAVIAREPGPDPEKLGVTVQSGIVTMTGQFGDRAAALSLLAAVRHLEGVVGVRDRLSYPRQD
jgi:CBS-domain-containing membrane protein